MSVVRNFFLGWPPRGCRAAIYSRPRLTHGSSSYTRQRLRKNKKKKHTKKHTPATLGHLEGICRSSRWLGQGLGEVAVGAVRALHRPAGAAGPAPANRREGRLMTPVPAGRCGELRGRKDARSAVLRDAHDASHSVLPFYNYKGYNYNRSTKFDVLWPLARVFCYCSSSPVRLPE